MPESQEFCVTVTAVKHKFPSEHRHTGKAVTYNEYRMEPYLAGHPGR